MLHRRLAPLAVALVALVCLAGSPAFGQSWAGRGRLQGTIKDEQGRPVEGAKITLRKGTERVDPATDGPKQITTDKNGKWAILGLAQGTWGILIEKEGYLASEGQAPVNEFGAAQPINITLKVVPKEAIEAAQKQAEQSTATGQAKALLTQGNDQLAAARASNPPDKAKLAAARTAYEEGLAKLEGAQLDKPEQQAAVAETKISVLQAIAGIDVELGDDEKAIARLKEVLAAKPDDVAVTQLLINVLTQAGKQEEAKTYMTKLPAGTKVDANVTLNMGIDAYNKGSMDKAFEYFDQVVKDYPDHADAYYYRGLVLVNKGKNAQAKADLQKFLELAPNSPNAEMAKEFLKSIK